MKVYHADLFNAVYDVNELGYKVSTDKHKNWYKVYIGPFKDIKEANKSLLVIQNKIAKDALIVSISRGVKQQLTINIQTANELNKKTEQLSILKTIDSLDVGVQGYLYNNTFEKEGAYSFSLEGYKYGLSLTGTKLLTDSC